VSRKILIIFLLQFFLFSAALYAQNARPKSFISFHDAENLAIENSHAIASQGYVVKSAKEDAKAQQVKRYPQLSFKADSLFQSKIGSISLPGVGNRDVGDHINWSTGPALDWVVWDTGQITKKAKSLEKTVDAQSENLDYNTRQVLLNARASYINVQLAKAQVVLVRDALKLARAQYSDILEKKKTGTADLLDLTVAHQEVVDRERDLETADGELAIARRNLLAALGYDPNINDADSIDVEPINNVLRTLLPRSDAHVNIESHPQVKALSDQEEAHELSAKSSSARHWPKITMKGTSTFEYPNLGDNSIIQQNKMLLNLHLPVFDWGMISKETKSNRYQAYSSKEQKEQTAIDLSRDTQDTRERIKTLEGLRIADVKAVKDAVEVARLTYDSYNAGRVIFLDVQRANVKALSVKVNSAQTDAELAMQISKLLALAVSEGAPQ
jgi:outer membrane protein TolC